MSVYSMHILSNHPHCGSRDKHSKLSRQALILHQSCVLSLYR